jgi:hypothetical protein
VAPHPGRLPELPAGTAKITYTSGTGQPGVCLSLAQMTAVCGSLACGSPRPGLNKHLTLLPLTTLLENLTGLYVPLLTGACSASLPGELGFSGSSKLDPALAGQALLRWPSHSLVLVPELLRLLLALCAQYPCPGRTAQGLRFVAVGGKVAPDLIAMPVRRGCRSMRATASRNAALSPSTAPTGIVPAASACLCPTAR